MPWCESVIGRAVTRLKGPGTTLDIDAETLTNSSTSPFWHKYYGNPAVKPTYANLNAELLQSDKNQVALSDETALVNVVTSSSVPKLTPLVSLATTTSMDPLNPQLTLTFNAQCVDK